MVIYTIICILFYSIKVFEILCHISLAGDHLKLGFPLASSITIVAWSIIDYPLGYSSAGFLNLNQLLVESDH